MLEPARLDVEQPGQHGRRQRRLPARRQVPVGHLGQLVQGVQADVDAPVVIDPGQQVAVGR